MAATGIAKRDLAAVVLLKAKPLNHGTIVQVSTDWVNETFPDVQKEAKEKFVNTFASAFNQRTLKDRNKSRFLTLAKHQPFLDEIIQFQTDPDQPSPPKAMKMSPDDEIEFMRKGIAFFKPRSDDAL